MTFFLLFVSQVQYIALTFYQIKEFDAAFRERKRTVKDVIKE